MLLVTSYTSTIHECLIVETDQRNEKENHHLINLDRDISNKALVGTIEREIASLGRLGGWDHRDHDVFLKKWTQLNISIFNNIDKSSGDTVKDPNIDIDEVNEVFTKSRGNLNSKIDDQKLIMYNSIYLRVEGANAQFIESINSKCYSVSNRPLLVRNLCKLLPGMNVDDIESHIDW